MFTKNEYNVIKACCENNNELSDALLALRTDALEELSITSHEIKNYAAYLKTAYQYISRKNNELMDNRFWNNMGTTIDELIKYMNRTALYRYSFNNSEITACTIQSLIERVTMYAGQKYADKLVLNINSVDAHHSSAFYISTQLLTLGINELIDNAYEAASGVASGVTSDAASIQPPVQLCITIREQDNNILLSISNTSDSTPDNLLINSSCDKSGDSNVYSYDLSHISRPFFTTKEGHAGLGLSGVCQMCILSGTEFSLTYNTALRTTTAGLTLKKIIV